MYNLIIFVLFAFELGALEYSLNSIIGIPCARGKILHTRYHNNKSPFENATESQIHWTSDNPLETTTEK